MTMKEVTVYLNEYQDNFLEAQERVKSEIYSQAVLIANFVGASLAGKKIQSYEEVFGSTPQVENSSGLSNEDILVTEQFKEFVRLHNKKEA